MGFYRDLALDLGTATVQGAEKGRGVVLQEANLAAVDPTTGQLLAVGQAAREMLDRNPGTLSARYPLGKGVISDGGLTTEMLRVFLKQVLGKGLGKPRLLLAVPTGITPVEERALIEAALQAGAGKVCLIEAPLAAAAGAGLDVEAPQGQMVMNLGAGVTDGAVIALGRVMASVCTTAAGDRLEEGLMQSVRQNHGLVLSRQTARKVKHGTSLTAKGRCLDTGLPREVTLTHEEVQRAFQPVVEELLTALRELLEQTPPDLAEDVRETGILLTGGGSLLTGLAETIQEAIGIPVTVAPDPELAVILGLEATLPHLNKRKDGPLDLAKQR